MAIFNSYVSLPEGKTVWQGSSCLKHANYANGKAGKSTNAGKFAGKIIEGFIRGKHPLHYLSTGG